MGRAMVGAILATALGGAACTTTEPTGFLIRYELRAVGCQSTGCASPDTVGIASAALGDTVWLFHRLSLVAAVGESTLVTLRPSCAENLTVLRGASLQRTVPATPSCPDSTYRTFLGFADRYTAWVVDSALVPGAYVLRGQVIVQPAIHPQVTFEIR